MGQLYNLRGWKGYRSQPHIRVTTFPLSTPPAWKLLKKIYAGSFNCIYSAMSVYRLGIGRGWAGGVLSPKSYVDVPAGPRKSDYLYTNFLPNFPPISILFSKEKHPIWIKLGAFYNNLPKIHPIYVIWAPSSLMKTPRSLYQISRKGAPKGRHIYVYHVNVRTPPPQGVE